ncbi:hypothetical protein [Vibrio tubiashii]|uniref:hypothetical protein n=1 Tax=Vibrio tubiashii TaxID=29498 RepID=UPI0012B5D8E5|nr:hypothetical protein [Vibrio tubiashii]
MFKYAVSLWWDVRPRTSIFVLAVVSFSESILCHVSAAGAGTFSNVASLPSALIESA